MLVVKFHTCTVDLCELDETPHVFTCNNITHRDNKQVIRFDENLTFEEDIHSISIHDYRNSPAIYITECNLPAYQFISEVIFDTEDEIVVDAVDIAVEIKKTTNHLNGLLRIAFNDGLLVQFHTDTIEVNGRPGYEQRTVRVYKEC